MKRTRKLYKRLKNDVAYLGIRVLVEFFRLMPRKAALSAGSMLGRLAPCIARKEYSLAVEHLTIAFGGEKDEKEIRRLAHETFRHLAMNFVDAARLKKMSQEEINNICVPHNLDRIKKSLAQGHGAICLTSHAGCWEMMGGFLPANGIPLASITKRLYDPRLEKLLFETRRHGGMKIISRGENTRDIIRALKDGLFLVVLIDQDIKVKGVFVDFFGQPAHTATAPASLSRKYNAPIIPLFSYRDELHRQHICTGEPIEIKATEDADSDILKMTEECSEAIEQFIGDHPEQWVWFHRRWKTKKSDV